MYNSLNNRLKERFGSKVYKLSLSGGMTCPNRDGTLSRSGCVFCSEGGSGDFSQSALLSIPEQIISAKNLISRKIPEDCKFIAYFQAFTNTYAPVEYLEEIYTQALSHPDIAALSIATRPDCLPDDVIKLINRLNKIKPVWVELGLQTIHKKTSDYINRKYELCCFDEAAVKLKEINVDFVVHAILGLPGETAQMMLDTVDYIGKSGASGIKLQLLHVLKNTRLAEDYKNGKFDVLDKDEYIDLVIKCIEVLPPHMIIHRLTGDGPKALLVAPLWSSDKRPILQAIEKRMRSLGTYQGRLHLAI